MSIRVWLLRSMLVAWMTMSLHVATTSSVLAECTSVDRWPSFRSLAPAAQTVLVGEVVQGLDHSAGGAIRFVLRVDDVLRGEAGNEITFDQPIQSGLPLECPDSMLRVPVGSVIALALDAPSEEGGDLLTTAAFMDREPHPFLLPGIETITREQLRRLMDLPDTDLLDDRDGNHSFTPLVVGGTLGLSALAGLAAATRLRRRYRDSVDRT
jgi:hypothetical protein